MESANIQQQKKHHPQDHHQLVGSSSLASTSCYGVGSSRSWTQNSISNTDSFSSYPNGGILNPREAQQNQNPLSSWNISMTPEMGLFHWANPAGNGRIKEEFSDNSNPQFTEVLNSQSSSIEDFRVNPSNYKKNNNELRDFPLKDLSGKLVLKPFSSGNLVNGHNFSPGNLYSNPSSTGIYESTQIGRGFSQIFPSINVSNFNLQSAPQLVNSGNMDMNLLALDLLPASKFNGNFMIPNSQNELDLYKEGLCYGLDRMQQSSQLPMIFPNKRSPLSNGVLGAKRRNSSLEPKAPKKSRIEPRASCTPFKVRKEKLGERIAALQQLVAPFGKTDTASVLMEAIGYIKFLQNQVETLTVPYMKSSRNKTGRAMKGVSSDNENEPKRGLRSRGLCLVPLSSLSYVTDGGGGAVWPPSHFGGAT